MPRESIPSTSSNLAGSAAGNHGGRTDALSVWELALEELATVLPLALRRISPTRASLLTDQIEELLRSEARTHLMCVAAAAGPSILADSVIAIAVVTPGSDTATILHVDWVQASGFDTRTGSTVGHSSAVHKRTVSESHAAAIWRKLETIFAAEGVQFVQWATDPAPTQSAGSRSAASNWPEVMNFSSIGTLRYLYRDADAAGKWHSRDLLANDGDAPEPTHPRVMLRLLDSRDEMRVAAFEHVVERTYVDSLDCPSLVQFRTPHEIIQGYRVAAGFAPDLWYCVETNGHAGEKPSTIGCIIMARHPGPVTRAPEQINPACVIELVYMGIVAEHRGKNYAQSMMTLAADICEQQGAERLILAVDEANAPALAVYRRSGMLQLFRETVWGRSV